MRAALAALLFAACADGVTIENETGTTIDLDVALSDGSARFHRALPAGAHLQFEVDAGSDCHLDVHTTLASGKVVQQNLGYFPTMGDHCWALGPDGRAHRC